MNLPKKVITKPGQILLCRIGKKSVELTPFTPLSLEDFSPRDLKASVIPSYLEQGIIEEYTNQVLPKQPGIVIPKMTVRGEKGDGETRVAFKQHDPTPNSSALNMSSDMDKNLPKELQERVERVKKAQKDQETILKERVAPRPKLSQTISPLKVRVDGKETVNFIQKSE